MGKIFITGLIIVFSLFACTKGEESVEEAEVETPKNAFSEYVDTGIKTLDESKELSKEADERTKEMEKMLDEID